MTQDAHLKPFEEPQMVSYSTSDLIIETVFTGIPHSAPGGSDRKLKRGVRPADAKGVLTRLARLP